ncbi:hypothetical protein ACS0TY_006789 [Phlomoides rotata]
MFGAYSLLKVIELELQGYLLASEGRVGFVCHWFKQPLMYLNKEQSMIVTLFSMLLEIFSVYIQMLRLVYQRM